MGISSAIPLAILLAGQSIRRWVAVVAVIVVCSGVTLAIALPSEPCAGHLGGVFCDIVSHGWERFGIVLIAFGVFLSLVAASRLPSSWIAVATVMGGITAALFLPSTSELSFPDAHTVMFVPPDHRLAWRFAIATAGALLAVLIWARFGRSGTDG